MTYPWHTTNEHYHTAPPQSVQFTTQPAHNTQTQHTLFVVRSQSSEKLIRSDTSSAWGRC